MRGKQPVSPVNPLPTGQRALSRLWLRPAKPGYADAAISEQLGLEEGIAAEETSESVSSTPEPMTG